MYAMLYPLGVHAAFHRATRNGRIPAWLRPLTSGIAVDKAMLEAVGPAQRATIVALLVFFSQRTITVDGRPQAAPSPLGAAAPAAVLLCVTFLLIAVDAYPSHQARRAFVLTQFGGALCMLQLVGHASHAHWVTSPQAVFVTVGASTLAVAMAIASG